MKHIAKGLGVANAKRDIPSPYLSANPLSKLTLWWMNNHIWRGFRRPHLPTDIYTVIPEETSQVRASRLDCEWKVLKPDEQRKRNSLLKTVLRNDWKLFTASIVFILLGEISKFAQPFLIAEIVSFFKGKGYVTLNQAWGYAAGMVLLSLFYSVFSTYGQFLGQVVAMRWRTSCTALMSRKASKLSSKALSELSSGTVINLLATDVEKFYNAAMEFRGLFVGPIVLFALLLIMSIEIHASMLPALVFISLLTAFRMVIGNISGKLRLKLADQSDRRIMLVTDIVSAMRMIKAYCWEQLFGDRAQKVRGEEVEKAGWVIFLNGLNLNLGHSCDRVVTFFLVVTFVLAGNTVDYKLAIQLLTWMKMGQLGFMNFPIGYSMWMQMEASLSRIQKFLMAQEFTGYGRIRKESAVNSAHQVKITLKDVSASWAISEKHATESQKMMKQSLLRSISAMNVVTTRENFVASGTFSLRNITLEVTNEKGGKGMLVGLVGPVGSGKTSLLLVILGNLQIGGGTRRLRGRIAYVPQQPWIRADTVRNNILMGEKMDRARYSSVLRACALQKDVAAMANGDSTLIGDKGSSLSGGQRARISLARAVYRNADIYILDDPFSSLDSKVGTHIFHECLQTMLKDKLIIMATHYVHLLKYTNHVIVLKEGKMLASGSLDKVKACVNLSELIKDPEHNMLDQTEIHDVFEKEDKKNFLMPLLSNDHIKKEHAHIPKKRATPFHVYISYWRAGYGYILMTLFGFLLIAQQTLAIMGEWWLVYQLSGGATTKKSGYGKDSKYDKGSGYNDSYGSYPSYNNSSYGSYPNYNDSYYGTYPNTTPANSYYPTSTPSFTVLNSSNDAGTNYAAASDYGAAGLSVEDQHGMLGLYAVFIWSSVIFGLLSVLAGTFFIVMAARNLYNAMFNKIMYAPMTTFSSDKTGEMVNRFARDTGRMDDIIPITINATFLTAAIIISQASYICVINHYVVLATLPFLAGLTLFVLYCVRSIRDTKRIESEFRTPTFEHLQHMLTGLEVVRAFEMEKLMIEESDSFLDRHTAAWHMYIGAMYWMKMRLNWLVTLYLAVVLIIALASPDKEAMATPLGLSLAYIIVFMNRIQYFATYATMLDANMTSVEHVAEYRHLEQEPPAHTDYKLPPGWPRKANIVFNKLNLIYPGSKTHALKDISFEAKSCEKIGIVGRTGAGKSSLFNVLLRLQQYHGSVEIDNVDTKAVGLNALRSKITFILQEPTLHSGTLRFNLDPFDRFTDEHLWDALEKVNLKKKVSRLPGRLDMEIEADGNNFSGGQQQLLCMARALLNMNKIMLLDEITANVDKETDTLIHKMINEEFQSCTILHISHRLESLIEYDNILVIDSGSVVEYDHPHVLLQNPEGQFYSMVQQLGAQQAKILSQIAKESYMEKFGRRRLPSMTEEEDGTLERKISLEMRRRMPDNMTTELRMSKMAVFIQNGNSHTGHVVHDVMTMPAPETPKSEDSLSWSKALEDLKSNGPRPPLQNGFSEKSALKLDLNQVDSENGITLEDIPLQEDGLEVSTEAIERKNSSSSVDSNPSSPSSGDSNRSSPLPSSSEGKSEDELSVSVSMSDTTSKEGEECPEVLEGKEENDKEDDEESDVPEAPALQINGGTPITTNGILKQNGSIKIENTVSDSEDYTDPSPDDNVTVTQPRKFSWKGKRKEGSVDAKDKSGSALVVRFQEPKRNGHDNPAFTFN